MDLNEHELAELEERLYSSVHHVSTEPCNTVDGSSLSNTNVSANSQNRLVTDRTVYNNGRRANSKLKRYWSSLQQTQGKLYPGIQGNKIYREPSITNPVINDTNSSGIKQTFTPYQSILGPTTNDMRENEFSFIGQKKRIAHNTKNGTSVSAERKRKMEQISKIRVKKAKAQKSRQKANPERLVATIEIESSSEEDGEYRSPDPIKQEIEEQKIECQDLEDSDPDEVVVIPSAPPPLVCIESSDDETDKKKFTHPNTRTKKNSRMKKAISPRCLSPSNSSIMSDDFIGQNERARLNDSFIEGITNDEELDCSVQHTVGSLLSGNHQDLSDHSRLNRAPSISSEGTVATSSDTTDPEKRSAIKTTVCQPPVSGQRVMLPKYSSTPKQFLPLKKQSISTANQSSADTDSIYTATSNRKSKTDTEKLASSDSSDDSNSGNVSAHSKRSKSNYSDSSCKSLKKSRKKRRKQDTEHYSDEDFALMLTDIVQAMSESGNKSENSEDNPKLQLETPSFDVTSTQSAESSTVLNAKGTNKISTKNQEADINVSRIEQQTHISSDTSGNSAESKCISSASGQSAEVAPVINLTESYETDVNYEESLGVGTDDPECCWNDEMKQFYHSSWNCEEFNVSTVMFNMPRSGKSWPIVHLDKYPDPPRKEIICNNCGERGHMRYKCRNRPKPGICYMCGQTGHQEPRCPNTLCLKCGEKTRNFVRGCQSCAREQNMSCHMCGVRGHSQRNCPDKWRRYHSTIEDNVPLSKSFIRNPNAKHCCICSRPGHQAHMCNSALRIFGQVVPTTEVKSYQPMYNINEWRHQRNQNTGQKFNMFSDLTDYHLHFDSAFAMNEKSFYNRFAKSVGLFEKKKRREEEMARQIRRKAKKILQRAEKRNLAEPVPSKQTASKGEESKYATPIELQISPSLEEGKKAIIQEDSNYSFSEFFEDPSVTQTMQTVESSADFIPLTSSTVAPSEPLITEIVPMKSEAKIFLAKPHAKLLLGPNGAAFLKNASDKFALQLSVLFQSVGNVLTINGLSKDQDNFHNELIKFLNDVSHQNEQIMCINNVPKLTDKTISYIVEHLRLLTRSYENVKNMFRRYQHFEQQGGNGKTADKIRRNLNIILFGQFGLREGRDHLNKLQVNLRALRSSKDINVSMDFRNEINQHIRYIFTAYDHADYGDILNEFEDLRKSQKLNKIKAEDLDLLPPSSTKNVSCTHRGNSDDSFNLSKGLNFEDHASFEQSHNEDLILNTSDQLIALPDQRALSNEPELSAVSIESAAIATIRQQHAMPKNAKFSIKKQKVESLLSECRLMVKQLDCPSIKQKFEAICCQAREGHMSKANFRTLIKIRSILKSKLQFQRKNTND
ncbi:uncharacterized protein LOC129722085 [Wyeomyia smithii]|uniref:uncharacterized protein LOC129722085 n=1 Tax=Wyeomyia smithii TaxID=174621 RepID=UPI002467CA75|nr:uncharacterized protein LOC129722085 [Wyeomyia smithii]